MWKDCKGVDFWIMLSFVLKTCIKRWPVRSNLFYKNEQDFIYTNSNKCSVIIDYLSLN